MLARGLVNTNNNFHFIRKDEKKVPEILLRFLEGLVGIANIITQTIISFAIVSIILEEKKFKEAFKSAIGFTKKELPAIVAAQSPFAAVLWLIFFLPSIFHNSHPLLKNF
jgi:hypothetical protein